MNGAATRRWLGVAILFCACWASADESQPVVAGYFPAWGVYERNYHVADLPAEQLTHVMYAFAQPVYNPTSDVASLVSFDAYADVENMYPGDIWEQPLKGSFNQLRKLKERYPHLKTLISAGGWTLSGAFSDIAASSNARLTFAASCVSYMTNYGFDGIDLDWEFPVEGGAAGTRHRPEDADNFVLLLQALRSRLDLQAQADGRPYWLTIATDGDPRHIATRYRIAASAQWVDWISVMTYNFAAPSDRKTGHNAPLYANPAQPYPELNVDSSVRAYLTNGVPRQKVVMGAPFYGHGFRNVAPTNSGLFQFHGGASEGSWGEPGSLDFRDLRDGVAGHPYISSGGFSNCWDSYTQTPYLFNPTSFVFIAYDNECSMRLKASYARASNLRGVMIWSLDSDTTDHALMQSLYRVLYPLTLQNNSSGLELSWHAWTGQVYRVRSKASLPDSAWVDCASLADGSGSRVSGVTGFSARVLVVDTNAALLGQRYYSVVGTNRAQ